MTLFVLVLVMKIGFGTSSVEIDMPDKQTCYAAAADALGKSGVRRAFCVDRTPR